MNNNIKMLQKNHTLSTEVSSKLLEELAFNRRPKIEDHMLIAMDKFIHEQHYYQPLQTTNKQLKIAFTFLTGYNSIFKVTIVFREIEH